MIYMINIIAHNIWLLRPAGGKKKESSFKPTICKECSKPIQGSSRTCQWCHDKVY